MYWGLFHNRSHRSVHTLASLQSVQHSFQSAKCFLLVLTNKNAVMSNSLNAGGFVVHVLPYWRDLKVEEKGDRDRHSSERRGRG